LTDPNISPSGTNNGIEAFEELFKKYYAPLVVYAFRYVPDKENAREIVQDFFVRFYERRDSLSIDISLKSYLYRSVYNCCINYIKQRNIQEKHIRIMSNDRDVEESLENEINTIELQHKIYKVIESMPARCRTIFKMNRLEGIKNEEIAARLNLSKRTVETQISKAIRILKIHLKDYYNDASK
jgi:RNA polymerase sigma-70 factor (family 1)